MTHEESLSLLGQMERRLVFRHVERIVLVEQAGMKYLGKLVVELVAALVKKTGSGPYAQWVKGTKIVLEYPRK